MITKRTKVSANKTITPPGVKRRKEQGVHWIDYEYPNTAYIVDVNYSGDIAITTCRCKDMPKPRDNSRGFTQGFWDYEQAVKYARHVAAELGIKAIV